MKVEGTDVGKLIKTIRRPGISTYQKLLHLLGSELVTCVVEDTIQQQNAIRAEKIFLRSSEAQAEYLIRMKY